jgi:hypothetical protein
MTSVQSDRSITGLIKHYENVSFSLYKSHNIKAKRNLYYGNVFNLLTIITTTFTGTASISILFKDYTLLKTTNVIVSYTIALLGMIQKQYNPIKRYQSHKNAAEEYLTLYYNIREYQTFHLQDDEHELTEYAKKINDLLEQYRKNYPYISDNVYDKTKQKLLSR